MPTLVLVAAVNGLQGIIKEAVEVNRAVLVVLRNQDVSKTLPANIVIQPEAEVTKDLHRVIAVDLLGVERQSDEEPPKIRPSEITDARASAPDGAANGSGAAGGGIVGEVPGIILQGDRFSFEGGIIAFSAFLWGKELAKIERLIIGPKEAGNIPAAEGAGADKDISGAVGETLNAAIMETSHDVMVS